ncbi:MAG TPA: tetratricopeptide repeat protein [Thermoanaerobaculia bacterium]|nr:tetratricopeptide repeat protein [Thermoanaerobaculia bacterium]
MRLVDELAGQPPEAHAESVRRSGSRYRGRLFVDHLLGAAKRCLPADPDGSRSFAMAALAAVDEGRAGARAATQAARALALIGNSRRIQGAIAEAERDFQQARRLMNRSGLADALASAEVDWLEGALRKRQRRLTEAEDLVSRSVLLYRLANDAPGAARALLSLSDIYRLQGDLDAALDAVYKALGSFERATDPILYLYARYDLAYNLYSSGRFKEALEHLVFDEDEYEACEDPFVRLLRLWLAAKLGAELADASAEPQFLEVRRLLAGRPLDLAHVALDLALLYFRLGRFDDVKKVAAEAAALFEAQSVHREVLAALLLFREAAFAQRVTDDLIRRVASVLERAKADPSLRLDAET